VQLVAHPIPCLQISEEINKDQAAKTAGQENRKNY
jgi:hypothetical protein